MRTESYYARRQTALPPRHHHRLWLLLIATPLIIAVAVYLAVRAGEKPTPIPLLSTDKASLTTKLNTIISAQPAKVGIAVTDIKTGYSVTAGSTAPFQAASTGKLLTAVAYYSLVENKQATTAEQAGAWPASFQMKEMINISDNDSWHDLEAIVTDSGLTNYTKSHNITYDVDDNTIAPAQMTKFLADLYNGGLIRIADRNQLFSYMQQTNMEQMLPAVTPASVTLYHKYGLLNGMLADVGITVHQGQAYAIAIYTQNSSDSDDLARIVTIRRIASTILRMVYPDSTPLSPPAPTSVDD